MITLPKVSIVVPVYNAEIYIKECLLSLLHQTYKNIEIVCVDDGSADTSLSMLKKYAEQDNRICIIRQENKGLSAARNAALRVLTGDYVMFCDSDDYLRLDAVALCVKTLFAHDGCEAVFFNARNFYENGVEFPAFSGEPYNRIPPVIKCGQSDFLAGFGNVCFGMFSGQLIHTNKLLFREGVLYEDWDFVAHFTSIATKVCWLDINLYNYRRKEYGTLTSIATMKCLDIFITLELVEQYYKAAGRWEHNQYIFYIKAIGHIIYFSRDRLRTAQECVKNAFAKKGQEFIQSIPYSLLCSLAYFFPLADRPAILSLHDNCGVELALCQDRLKKLRIVEFKNKIKNVFKRLLVKISPAYRVITNTRAEMEQMHGEIMYKLCEVASLQYENRENVNIFLPIRFCVPGD